MTLIIKLLAVSLLYFSAPSSFAEENLKGDYSDWVKHLKQEAVRQGYQSETIEATFKLVSPDEPNEKVIRLDQYQPERLENFYEYYNKRVTKDFIRLGRKHYAQRKVFFDGLEKKYNVPGAYIIALWGSETSYGRVHGQHNILDATATLSWRRRHDFFTKQFFAAMTIMEKHNRSAEDMKGSWASAMGHMQFIPTTFLQYGRDGDGDSKIDIWENEVDAFTSAAYYLYRHGWKADLLWGREVRIDKPFNYKLANIDFRKPIPYWKKKHVKRFNHQNLPNANIRAAVIAPSGKDGPKFVVYHNFHRLLRWNNSVNNMLTVSLLANAIAERPALQSQNITHSALKKEYVEKAQKYLNQLGYDAGKTDGIFGSQSRQALEKYERARKLTEDGYLDIETYKKLHQDADK